jgi:hypothetical protein
MTPLTPFRVPLLLETTKVMKPACSAVKIRGRTAFRHGEAPDWVFWRAFAKVSSEKFRSIDFRQNSINRILLRSIEFFRTSEFSKQFHMNFCHSSLIDLQNIKTQKLTKASENNKAKGLTNVNQGVQIHNIWHSSLYKMKAGLLLCMMNYIGSPRTMYGVTFLDLLITTSLAQSGYSRISLMNMGLLFEIKLVLSLRGTLRLKE